jgi:hypothetical protein
MIGTYRDGADWGRGLEEGGGGEGGGGKGGKEEDVV